MVGVGWAPCWVLHLQVGSDEGVRLYYLLTYFCYEFYYIEVTAISKAVTINHY